MKTAVKTDDMAAGLGWAVLVLAHACVLWTARGASFDCAKAAQPLEKTIFCGDPALSKADETLAQRPGRQHSGRHSIGPLCAMARPVGNTNVQPRPLNSRRVIPIASPS